MQEEEAAERVWQRYNPLARNDTNQRRGPDGRGPDDILHKDFLRKYVFFAKSRPAPKVCPSLPLLKPAEQGSGTGI
jgi:hypothetical protein